MVVSKSTLVSCNLQYIIIILYQERCLEVFDIFDTSSLGFSGQEFWSCARDKQGLQRIALLASRDEAIIHKFSSTVLQSLSPF